MTDLALDPTLDLAALALEYRTRRRVRIPGFLQPDGLKQVHAALVRRDDWRQLFIDHDAIVQRTAAERLGADAAAERALERRIHERACLGFQYRYEGIRIPDVADDAAHDPLSSVATFLASAPVVAALEQVIGMDGLRFGEGQATAYSPGDFLTCHDDGVKGKNRVAAFVLNMTPSWRPDWGGLLMFHADDDAVLDAHVPRFNTLDLFAVPQRHSVSYVTPAAPGRRLALTGWLRPAAA